MPKGQYLNIFIRLWHIKKQIQNLSLTIEFISNNILKNKFKIKKRRKSFTFGFGISIFWLFLNLRFIFIIIIFVLTSVFHACISVCNYTVLLCIFHMLINMIFSNNLLLMGHLSFFSFALCISVILYQAYLSSFPLILHDCQPKMKTDIVRSGP